ncbi:hypothetical protein [uncultured Shewanella sp.]|uniref:hypothetical protein n=1 Tax=uncultured Shewanella sp. TaxID=173975 RepID=UPI00262E07C0|nr:hypothetical protein [uncultured Shewanella sp.]
MMKYSLFRLLISVFSYFSLSHIVFAGSTFNQSTNDLLIENNEKGLMLAPLIALNAKNFPSYQPIVLFGKEKESLQVNTTVTIPTLSDIEFSTFVYDYTFSQSVPQFDRIMNTPVNVMAATQVKERGLLINIPLSIVNMPINIGVLPSVIHADVEDLSYQSAVNLDMQLSMKLADNLQFAVSGSHLFSRAQFLETNFTHELDKASLTMLTAGVAYDWNTMHFSTDIDLYRQAEWDDAHPAQFWRVGGDLNMFSWLDVNLSYYYNMKNNQESLYSMGSEFKFGDKFSVDFSGIYRQSNHIEGLLRTSYDF